MASSGGTSTGSLVDVEIGKSGYSGTYDGSTQCKISFSRNDGQPDKGYKKYIHTPPKESLVKTINQDNNHQPGLTNIESKNYEIVSAYYLDYDVSNFVPLIVGFTDKNSGHHYYTRTTYSTLDEMWKEDNTIKDTETCKTRLAEICNRLTDLVVLKLDCIQETYFVNGTGTPPERNKNTKVKVTKSEPIYTIYHKYVHTLEGIPTMRVISSRHKEQYNAFILKDLGISFINITSASIYYWSGDAHHHNPLVLEMNGSGGPKYFKRNGDRWFIQNIRESELEKTLHLESCTRNREHFADIGNTGTSDYKCLSCGKITIHVESKRDSDHIKSVHTTKESGFVGTFTIAGIIQSGIDIIYGINTVTVFSYPIENPNPLLILYNKKWYERISENTWKEIEDKDLPINEDSKDQIEAHLQQIDYNEPYSYADGYKDGHPAVSIIVGAVIGLALACFVVHECLMLRSNAAKSIIMKVMSKFHKRPH